MKNLLIAFALVLTTSACAAQDQSSRPAAEQKPASAAPATGESSTPAAPAADPAKAPASEAARSAAASASPAANPVEAEKPAFREVIIPEGTTLALTLRTAVASDTSNVEDQVRATLRRPVAVDGVQALPEGTALIGHVTDAVRSAKVKGRARIAFRFTRADLPGEGGQLNIRTGTVAREAEPTKKRDAATIGGGAVGGAIIGGIVGGGDGAAKGAVIGGGAGTAAVLATRGKEVRLPSGTVISVKLAAPVTVRVPLR
jgi:hypothetical protein